MTRRLFLGIRLSDDHGKTLSAYSARMAGRFPDAKWVPEANFHLTVVFFGDVDESLVPPLLDSLRSALAIVPVFPLAFDGTGFAPPRRPATMIWGNYAASDDFSRLVRMVADASVKIIGPIELPEQVLPHVTIARLKGRTSTGALPTLAIPEPLVVASCALFESVLAPEGPSYGVIAELPFGARP